MNAEALKATLPEHYRPEIDRFLKLRFSHQLLLAMRFGLDKDRKETDTDYDGGMAWLREAHTLGRLGQMLPAVKEHEDR